MQKNHFNLFTKFLNATLHILNIFSLIIYLKMERRSVLIVLIIYLLQNILFDLLCILYYIYFIF